MLKCDREIVLPFAIARRAGIVRDHRRTALRERGSRCARKNDRDR
jgi:hypothetical protein